MTESAMKEQIISTTLEKLGDEPVEEVLAREMGANDSQEWRRVYQICLDELTGYGPIKDLLLDPEVSEVLINGPADVFYEKKGKLLKSAVTFTNALTLERFVKRLLLEIDKTADRRFPIAEGTLKDGTRLNITLPPVTKQASLSFRRHLHSRWSLEDLVNGGMLDAPLAKRIRDEFEDRANILICGPTGVGKTTLLRALLFSLPAGERIITVEDTDEIGIESERGVSLLTRLVPDDLAPPITLNDLLKQSLRMRPDRIVVGEIRGEEALVFLDAMSTGHGGSLSSIHAGSTRQALTRLESLVTRAAPQWPPSAVKQLIFEGIDLVICVGRKNECRRVLEVSELAGIESFGYLLSHWEF